MDFRIHDDKATPAILGKLTEEVRAMLARHGQYPSSGMGSRSVDFVGKQGGDDILALYLPDNGVLTLDPVGYSKTTAISAEWRAVLTREVGIGGFDETERAWCKSAFAQTDLRTTC